MTTKEQSMERLIERANARVEAMTQEEREAMWKAQRESWVRGMAPCEHGIADWETCPNDVSRPTNEKIAELLQQQTYDERMEMARWLRDPITDQSEEITTDYLAGLIGLWAEAELDDEEEAS